MLRPTSAPLRCDCRAAFLRCVFRYDAPPETEVRFRFSSGAEYRREVWRCDVCRHFVSVHGMDQSALYTGDYVTSSYGDDGIRRTFDRIVALDPALSDNAGRVRRILDFAATHVPSGGRPSVLDVGSGLCVFLHAMKAAGWECTALDPDGRAVRHARDTVGVAAVEGDFMRVADVGSYDLVTFNRVLEHVADPVAMLDKARRHVRAGGFVYVEVPDGESAAVAGQDREEFFIDHLHVFSAASVALLGVRAGFTAPLIERLREPSGKYTLRAFFLPDGARGESGA